MLEVAQDPFEVWPGSDAAVAETSADLAQAVRHLGVPACQRLETGASGGTVCHVAADKKTDLVVSAPTAMGWAQRALLAR